VTHAFAYQSAGDGIAAFRCANCGIPLNFVLPTFGEPTAVADGDGWAMPEGWEVYVGSCEPATSDVPLVITKRQFLIQLLRAGMVDASEVPTLAITPPALMAAVIAGMTTEEQLETTLSWASMTQVERYSPLTLAASAAAGTTTEQLDDFFRAAAQI
jgi:hypothetical protein